MGISAEVIVNSKGMVGEYKIYEGPDTCVCAGNENYRIHWKDLEKEFSVDMMIFVESL